MRRLVSILLIAVLSGSAGLIAHAEETSGFGSLDKSTKPEAKKDASATAFALPKGVALRKDQQPAYEKLKKEYQSKLHDAVSKVQSANDEKEKTAAAQQVQHLRGEVKDKLAAILNTPDPELAKQQAKAQQQMQQQMKQMQQQQQKHRARWH